MVASLFHWRRCASVDLLFHSAASKGKGEAGFLPESKIDTVLSHLGYTVSEEQHTRLMKYVNMQRDTQGSAEETIGSMFTTSAPVVPAADDVELGLGSTTKGAGACDKMRHCSADTCASTYPCNESLFLPHRNEAPAQSERRAFNERLGLYPGDRMV